MPEPFNRPMINVHSAYNEISIPSSSEQKQAISAIYSKDMPLKVIKAPGMSLGVETSRVITNQQPIVASHLSQSFRRQFSKPLTNNDADQTDVQQKLSKTSDETLIVPVLEPCIDNISPSEETKGSATSQIKSSSISINSDKCMSRCESTSHLLPGPLPATPMKVTDTVKCKDDSLINIDGLQSTPAKLASTPARLMSSTPSLSTPKRRCYMTPEDVSASTPNKLVRRPQRSRSLKFDTPVKEKVNDEDNEIEDASVDDDILGILPENLIQSVSPIMVSL